jgi:monofunctional biosynthetic peptidoglycan transglycosylase
MKLFRRLLFWLVAVPLLLVILLQAYFLLQICWWINFNPSSTSFMRQQLSVLQEKIRMRSYSINGCRITAFPRI